MWAHPGRPLLFMGGELGQKDEWHHDRSIDWHLLDHAEHRGIQQLVRTLNSVYRDEPALWDQDFEWTGFRWIDPNDADHSVLSFLRYPTEGRTVACIANLTPVVREHRVGVPEPGRWVQILNTDATQFGGSGVPFGEATQRPCHGTTSRTRSPEPSLRSAWSGSHTSPRPTANLDLPGSAHDDEVVDLAGNARLRGPGLDDLILQTGEAEAQSAARRGDAGHDSRPLIRSTATVHIDAHSSRYNWPRDPQKTSAMDRRKNTPSASNDAYALTSERTSDRELHLVARTPSRTSRL